MSSETNSLIIPHNSNFTGTLDSYIEDFFSSNQEIRDILGDKDDILDEFVRLLTELKSNYSSGLIYFTLGTLSGQSIIRFNRAMRSKNKEKVSEFLKIGILNLKNRIEITKERELPRVESTVDESGRPNWLSVETTEIAYQSDYSDFLVKSLSYPISKPSNKDNLPKDSRVPDLNSWMQELVEKSKKERDEHIWHRHSMITEDNIVRKNLWFLDKDCFALIAIDKSLDVFFDLINTYQEWIDRPNILAFQIDIIPQKPFGSDEKKLLTSAYALLLGKEYNSLFDDTNTLRDGIDSQYLSGLLRENGVLTDEGVDIVRMENILAGYE